MTIYRLIPVYFSVYLLITVLIAIFTIICGELFKGSLIRKILFFTISLSQIFVIPYIVIFINLFGYLTPIVRTASQADPNYLSAWQLYRSHVIEFSLAWLVGIAVGLLIRYWLLYRFHKMKK